LGMFVQMLLRFALKLTSRTFKFLVLTKLILRTAERERDIIFNIVLTKKHYVKMCEHSLHIEGTPKKGGPSIRVGRIARGIV
jgi:hypothetical protein